MCHFEMPHLDWNPWDIVPHKLLPVFNVFHSVSQNFVDKMCPLQRNSRFWGFVRCILISEIPLLFLAVQCMFHGLSVFSLI